MKPRIAKLTIEGFRAIRRLEIDSLGRVNLITGKNNTGKSSVLEALRLLASGALPMVILDILRLREEDDGKAERSPQAFAEDGLFLLCGLFHGFPRFSPENKPIVIASEGGRCDVRLSVRTTLHPSSPATNFEGKQEHPGISGAIAAIEVEDSVWGSRQLSLNAFYDLFFKEIQAHIWPMDEPHFPCEFVSPYGGERTPTLGPLWDKIALSDGEKAVVAALRIITCLNHRLWRCDP